MDGNDKNDGLIITDPEHALIKMGDDLKLGNVSQFQDLIVEVLQPASDEEVNFYSNPNLYINMASQENLDEVKIEDGTYDLGKLKPSLGRSDIQCSFYGEELCVISGKEILDKNAALILVGVFCNEKCTFRLKSDLEVEVNLKPGKMHQVYFAENQQRIFRFQIPQDDSIETIEIRGISDSKFGQFEMLVLQGNEVPSSSNALTLTPAWENGYIGKFERMTYAFCTGCNYTVLVSAKTAGYLTLGSKVSNATIDLNSFKDGETYDYVHFWGLQCYSYFVSEPHKPFTINVQSYGGIPLIFVNPLIELNGSNFQKALFNSKDHFQNEELVLDPELRDKNNAITGTYYICIYGQTATSYKISAKNADHTNMLKAGLLESRYIEPAEIKEFYFTDKILRDDSIKVQVKTNVMVGSVRIKSKICPRSSADITESIAECYFTPKEMNEEEENENVFKNTNTISELPEHNICAPDRFYISQDLGQRKDGEAGCILVFGVLGVSNYTSHFSVMLQLEGGLGKSHPLILSQGVPDFQQIKIDEKQYYQITVEDPDIQKLTVLLTTIHGWPDLFISTTTRTPSETDFKWASYNAGIYPDMIVIKKEESDSNNLTNNYYVTVQSNEESTYSIVYYTHNSKNEAGIQKLMVGKKQRGVLHLPDNITETVKNEAFVISKEVQVGEDIVSEKNGKLPSLVYHFQVPAIQLAQGKAVRISLNVENGGDLMYLVKANSVPELAQDYSKKITDDHWVGYNYRDVLIKLEELDKQLKQEVQDSQNTTNATYLIDFYIKIYPRTIFVFDAENKNKQPIVFTISFFDEEQFIHLLDGIPYRGALDGQAPDYFYFDIQDLNVDYEISLNAISGGYSDLHLTLDPNDKFMKNQTSMLTSANRFTTDSIILTKEMIAHAIKMGYGIDIGDKQIKQILQVYIQVNTSDTLSVYSIVFSKLSSFSAIQLTLGQIQQGSVKPNETKLYFLSAHSTPSSKPLRIDLYPSNGNPEIEVTILTNQQFSQSELSDLLKQPTFKQKMVRGEESLLIDLNKDEKLQCKENCVIVIAISDRSIDKKTMIQSHFRLQVSQDFQELQDGEAVQGKITILQQNCTHFGQYMFYRFYKPCGMECDFVLQISPDQILENVLSVLVNFEDPSELAGGAQTPLPTWQSKPTWSFGVKTPTVITIEGTEPYFQERTQAVSSSGKVLDTEQVRSSIGYFIIGIQSYADVSFKIQGGTVLSNQDADEKMIDIQQLYVGRQQREVYLKPGQSKYFFFRNWREESITFSLDFQTQNLWDNVQMEVSQLESGDAKSGHGSGGRIPKTEKELESRILNLNLLSGEFIEINPDSEEFCFMCMYIVFVTNMNDQTNATDGDAKFNIEVQQSLDDLSDEIITKHEGTFLQSFLQIGRPQPLNLQKYDKIKLQFSTSQEVKIELETRLGSVQVRLERSFDDKVLYNYTYSRKTLIRLNITNEDLRKEIQDDDGESWGVLSTKFNLIVTADSNDYEGSVLIRDPNALSILTDGKTIDLYFEYKGNETKGVKRNGRYHQTLYFMLLPSSHSMDLQIQAGLKTFSSQQGTFNSENSLIINGQTSLREQLLDSQFFHFKASFKKIETMENLKNSNVKWTEEFTEDEQFDEVIESSDANIYSQIFTRLHFENNPETDLILVKLDGSFSPKHSKQIEFSELVYKFIVTSSDISYLKVNEEIRAAVEDDSTRFKIFEFNINPLDFPEDDDVDDDNGGESKVDLFIQLTPCTGHLKYFLSDNLEDLFLDEQALVYSMLSPIMITNHTVKKGNDDRLNLEVIHKRSKIQQSIAKIQASNLGLFQSDDTNGNTDLVYLDQFGVQGKRLKNVQKLNNTKIYIGVRTLSAIELNQKNQEFSKHYQQQGDVSNLARRQKLYQKFPEYGAYLSSDKDVATFRILSYYILNDQLDVLDRYNLLNPYYGIMIEQSKTKGSEDKVKISWSPIISFNLQDDSNYKVELTNITYKLLIAYSFDVAQVFQSACEVEFVQFYLEEKYDNLLKLEDANNRHLKFCGSRILENQSLLDSIEQNLTIMTVKNEFVEVIPDGKLEKIKSIIVIAEIEENDEDFGWGIQYLPYAPVNFDRPIHIAMRHHRWLRILITVLIFTVSSLLISFVAYCYFRKRKNDSNTQSINGIALSNIQNTQQQNDTQVSGDTSKKTTGYDSERKEILSDIVTARNSELDDPRNKKESDNSIDF